MLSKAKYEVWAAMDWLKKAEQALYDGEPKKAVHAAEVAQDCLDWMKKALR